MSSLWPRTSTHQSHSNPGSHSHRAYHAKTEWSKPTSIISSRPLNSHKSIDGRTAN